MNRLPFIICCLAVTNEQTVYRSIETMVTLSTKHGVCDIIKQMDYGHKGVPLKYRVYSFEDQFLYEPYYYQNVRNPNKADIWKWTC